MQQYSGCSAKPLTYFGKEVPDRICNEISSGILSCAWCIGEQAEWMMVMNEKSRVDLAGERKHEIMSVT